MDGYLEIAQTIASWGYHALIHNWQVRGDDPTDNETETDLAGVVRYLREHPAVDQSKITVMGFCRGGVFAFVAARLLPSIRAITVFHGFCWRYPKLDEDHTLQPCEMVGAVKAPVLLLHGTADKMAPIDGIRELNLRLRDLGVKSELHEYEGVDHGFAVSTHPGFVPEAARDSFVRAERFLRECLR
jgi:carboxymethylenebutenolidase